MKAYNRTLVIVGFLCLIGWMGFLCSKGQMEVKDAGILIGYGANLVVNYVTIKGQNGTSKT